MTRLRDNERRIPERFAWLKKTLLLLILVTASAWAPVFAIELSPTISTPAGPISLTIEGSSDWAHWGLRTATSLNRRAAGASQISDIVTLGSAARRFQGSTAVWPNHTWSGGTPEASATTTAGLYLVGDGNGYQFTVPADTATRILQVHLGGFRARAQIEISLSDGSVAPYVTTVEDLGGAFVRTVAVTYSAASAGQTLTLRFFKLSGSNIALQSATLQGVVANAAPVLASIGNMAATVNAELTFVVQATDADGPSPLILSNSALPAGAIFTLDPVVAGRGTFTWTPTAAALPGPYSITFTATEDNGLGLFDEETIQISVAPASAGGTLLPTVSGSASLINLSTEGTADWAHWGLTSATSVNRKSGVTTQISNITAIGSAGRRFQGAAAVWPLHDWNDGTPTTSASSTSGLYFVGAGNGYQFTVPADTTMRTLQVHLGGFRARAQIEVSLSDGSVAPFVTTVENLTGAFVRILTVSFNAASAGQSLIVRYSKLTGSNIALQSATLQGALANAPPELDPIGNQAATVDAALTFVVQASDPDGPAPLLLSYSTLPPGAVFTPDAGVPGRGTFSWTPASADVPGPYSVTFTATEDNGLGLFDQETIQISVSPASGGTGSLSPAVTSPPAAIDLTTEGSADWAHWGLTSATSVTRKSGVVTQIGDIVALGSAARRFQGSAAVWPNHRWSDGSPTTSASTTTGLYFVGAGNGYEFSVPADTTVRTLIVHLGGFRARAQIEVSLSDGSVAPYVATVENLGGAFVRTLTVSYNATSAGQSLLVRYFKLSGSNIALQSASLQGGAPTLELPFIDNFTDGDSVGWSFSNDTPTAHSWAVANNELLQSAVVESVNSFEESYHLGTYAWLPAGTSLTDYLFSVSVRRANSSRPDSLGVLFRYRDQNNYYRLTINARQGFLRLERREAGVFFTLAKSAFGLDPAASYTLLADLTGPDIRISIDGTPVLAATDTAHASGTVGLFTQSPAGFDDVIVAPPTGAADIRIANPTDFVVVPGNTVDVNVLVRNMPPSGSVEISMPGNAPVVLSAPPWTASFSGLVRGETSVTANLRDSGSNTIDSHVINVAIDGIYALAIGDSITNGAVDGFAGDNDDAQRVSSDRAYASTLAALLEGLPPTEAIVFNEGIGGDTAAENDTLRLQSLLERHPDATTALLQFGTNDALAGDSAANYETSMQAIVDRLGTAGVTSYVATLPPILGGANPLTSANNGRIGQYNDVIRSNLTGAMPGADLWGVFAPDDTSDGVADRIRADLFADNLHPNALGHSIIAALWFNVLLGDSTGTAISPFFVDRISQAAYRQNLIEAGDTYLIDSAATVQALPPSLGQAVWIETAQADAANTAANFLTLELDRAATIYIAYDSDATLLPNWLNPATSAFSSSGLTVQTSQTNYDLYIAPASAGSTVLGGNLATGGGDASDMYLVLLTAP